MPSSKPGSGFGPYGQRVGRRRRRGRTALLAGPLSRRPWIAMTTDLAKGSDMLTHPNTGEATTSPPIVRDEFDSTPGFFRTRRQFRRAIVEGVLFMVLAVGGGLLFWGGHFATNMVHDQLVDQKISFPAKGT